MDGGLGLPDGVGKAGGVLIGQGEHEKGQPLGALPANAGQAGKLLHQTLQSRRKVFHAYSPRKAAMAAAGSAAP